MRNGGKVNEMGEALSKSNFVEPYEQVELGGELGLLAADIARSLDISPTMVRRKLRNGMLVRIKNLRYQALQICRANKINGLQEQDFVLDVRAARFFASKYENDIGDAYCAYLLECEDVIMTLEKEAKEDPVIMQSLQIINIRRKQNENTKRIGKLEDKVEMLNPDTGYSSIRGYFNILGKAVNLNVAKAIGMAASKFCKVNGIERGTVPDERYGEVKTYPKSVLDEIVPRYVRV